MNASINDIAEECGIDATPESPAVDITQQDLEFFAKRIIEECARVCEDKQAYECSQGIYKRFNMEV